MTDQDSTEKVGRGPKAVVCLLLLCAAIYVVCAVVVDMPSSPVQTRVAVPANKVIHPVFDQDWQLFAPTPATSNSLIKVTAVTERGGTRTTQAPFDIEAPLEKAAIANPVVPTKLAGLSLAANEEWNTYRTKLQAIKSTVAPQNRQAAIAELDHQYRFTYDSLDRAASYYAHARFPGTQIVKVRVTFYKQDMVPFSRRNDHPVMPVKPLLQTSWLPYIADIDGGS
ncbi:DUF5819 family protein [Williamsia phyllosphaerae]|uniref:Uncharacterized protein n=1 Tax=Williamsia phyllosphaerae TaxID=885042 RepID=A0ABQ1UFL8_9NOCA|nr:DUF5819 family protein [Williamsia phyllosphaerae]GGF17965.1 hypothetical protein GCM10007298_12510 [Williamsia phyllosphaerae]